MIIDLTEEKREMLYWSVRVRQCFIETGTSYLRATDAENWGRKNLVKTLTIEQMKLISLLEELKVELLK